MTDYAHGVPSWVDYGAADLAAAVRFYTELFGWEAQDMGPDAGHYTITSKGGRMAAALSPAQHDGPPRWTTYINVDDLDDVLDKAKGAGGTVLFGPQDVMAAGRMSIVADPTGAVIAFWQPAEHKGAQVVNEPGALAWNELSTSDLDRAKAFYSAVLGWEWGGAPEYAEAKVAGRTICGAQPRPEAMPAAAPDGWLVYFGSADLDADTGRAAELGATVSVGPMAIPGTGRFSVLVDPQGGVFALFQG
ncbi:MAG TPA: VOC family protein [Acidimicrobiales bacterium]|nr:VOC family protein [Acidimicrobiales bacterium]